MRFKEIKPARHYIEHHSNIPWYEVVGVVLNSKDRRKRGNKLIIKQKDRYILCELKNKTLWVINAK
ncbi:hypothetical protein FJZ53_03555 [Candidatus Woesearchaeota archaeon]|nr:hypothetical protein [Candidatus Woesearchaeota archaeon]